MPVSSRLIRKSPSSRPTVGKFCTPEKPMRISSSMKTSISRNGSVPQTPASTGTSLHDRQHLARHVDDDRVGVAVGHQPRERAAARHAVAAGVVDDDQVDAAGLGALGREAGARACADHRPAARDRRLQPRERLGALHAAPPTKPCSLATIASAKAGSLMSVSSSIELHVRTGSSRARPRTAPRRPSAS